MYVFTLGKLTYPETVTVSSTGGASERQAFAMGVYKITNITHSGRPVWQSTVREDRYLFYNGNNNIIIANNYHFQFLRWLVGLGYTL